MGAKDLSGETRTVIIPDSAKRTQRFVQESILLRDVVSWSKRTLLRRIEEDGFPYHLDSSGRMYDMKEVEAWFRERKGRHD